MTQVVFKKPHVSSLTLGAADLKRAGVEGFTQTVFKSGEPVEVSDDVAEVLVESARFKGFSVYDSEAETAKTETTDESAKNTGGSSQTGLSTATAKSRASGRNG